MKLQYNPHPASGTGVFYLRVPRPETQGIVRNCIEEHGLDLSMTASSAQEAVLLTRSPYAALAFWDHADSEARGELAHIKGLVDSSWATGYKSNLRMPADQELWPFQRAGVAYALARKHSLLGDQPGLGKTAQAIVFANEIRASRVLVVCPASVRIQWTRMIARWSTMRQPTIHYIGQAKHGVHPSTKQNLWTVTSYELARSPVIGKLLAQGPWDALILDEAHYVKASGSRRTRAIFGGGTERAFDPIAGVSERVVALTGTPLPNRPREAYVLARNLCWDSIDWASEDKFRERYNPTRKVEFTDRSGKAAVRIDERTGRAPELQARLRAHLMTRHLKRDVLTQLPSVVHDILTVDKTEPVRAALKAESMLEIDPEELSGADMSVMGHIAEVRHQMGVALAPQVADYAAQVLDGGEDKLVIFCIHREVVRLIAQALGKHGVVAVTGDTSLNSRQHSVDQFATDRNTRVFLANLQAAGTGTDGLQNAARHIIFAECSWVHGENQQGIDRLHRMGQQQGVQVEFMVAPGSISEKVLANALRKGRNIHKVLDARS